MPCQQPKVASHHGGGAWVPVKTNSQMASKRLTGEVAPLDGVTIEFRNVFYSVKDRLTGNSLDILSNVSGKVWTSSHWTRLDRHLLQSPIGAAEALRGSPTHTIANQTLCKAQCTRGRCT